MKHNCHLAGKYIYCPWMAPESVQKAANCRIGVDYPLPIVNHVTKGALCHYRLKTIMSMLHKLNTSSEPTLTQNNPTPSSTQVESQ